MEHLNQSLIYCYREQIVMDFSSKAFLTEWSISLAILSLLATYASWKLIHALYLSPLSQFPGPISAKLSGAYLLFVDITGRRARSIEALHQVYGPIVQIGPKEISFDSIEALDIIYGPQSQCIRASWYDSITREGLFKLRHIAEHRERRKQISRAFSPASAYELEPNVAILLRSFINIIEKQRQTGPLEIRHWFRMLAFDLSGMAFVGAPYGGLEAEQSPQFLNDMENSMLIWDLEGRFPLLLSFIRRIPSKTLGHFFNCADRLYHFSDKIFGDYIADHGRSSGRRDIIAKLLQKDSNSGQGLTDYQLSCDIANLTLAATDTSSIVLSYLFWELALNPDTQDQLRRELRSASIDPEMGKPMHQTLVNLPYLNATINETMRLHSPIPMGLLRQAPSGGCTIEGYHIPGETIISMSSGTAHRNPVHFPDPESYKPSRWIARNADSDAAHIDGSGGTDAMKPLHMPFSKGGGTDAMKKLYMPFSRGMYKCIGQTLAMVNLRIVVATLILKYDFKLAKEARLSDMDWDDHFMIIPRKGCFLNVAPVAEY